MTAPNTKPVHMMTREDWRDEMRRNAAGGRVLRRLSESEEFVDAIMHGRRDRANNTPLPRSAHVCDPYVIGWHDADGILANGDGRGVCIQCGALCPERLCVICEVDPHTQGVTDGRTDDDG